MSISTHLAQFGITVSEAREFLANNLDNLPKIIEAANFYNVTGSMITEIYGDDSVVKALQLYAEERANEHFNSILSEYGDDFYENLQNFHEDNEVGKIIVDLSSEGLTTDLIEGDWNVIDAQFVHGITPPLDASSPLAVDNVVTGTIEKASDKDWYALELNASETYTITMENTADEGRATLSLLDEEGLLLDTQPQLSSEGIVELSLTPDESGTYYLMADSIGETAVGDYQISYHNVTSQDDYPMTSPSPLIEMGSVIEGNLEVYSDEDKFAVELDAGHNYTLSMTSPDLNSVMLRVLNSEDETLMTSQYNFKDRTDTSLSFTPEESDTYYILASQQVNISAGSYQVSIEESDYTVSWASNEEQSTSLIGVQDEALA